MRFVYHPNKLNYYVDFIMLELELYGSFVLVESCELELIILSQILITTIIIIIVILLLCCKQPTNWLGKFLTGFFIFDRDYQIRKK